MNEIFGTMTKSGHGHMFLGLLLQNTTIQTNQCKYKYLFLRYKRMKLKEKL